MLLSIGIITKNEEKYIRQCLEVLMPIKNAIESEIVVVDTGSTDNTVKIAREYTDKVYFFKWCNDFSAARNETLRYCTGEWYLFFDADEILQNPDVIIDFFKSGEYKKYNSASYIKRNYTMTDLSCYSDQNTLRLVRKTADLHFEGIIHEQIMPVISPSKRLDALFNHYGYLYFSDEERREKAQRNVDLLRKQCETAPTLFCMLQLAESLRGIDCGESLNTALTAMNMYNNMSENEKVENRRTYHLLHKIAAAMYHGLKNLDGAAEIIDAYFELENRNIYIDMEMYALAGFVLFDMGAYEMCVGYFEEYNTLYNEYHNGGASNAGYTVGSVSPFEYRSAVYTAVSACINVGADEDGADWLDRVPITEFNGSESDLVLRIMIEDGYDKRFGTDRVGKMMQSASDSVKKVIAETVK